jgi:hypothetical protein
MKNILITKHNPLTAEERQKLQERIFSLLRKWSINQTVKK